MFYQYYIGVFYKYYTVSDTTHYLFIVTGSICIRVVKSDRSLCLFLWLFGITLVSILPPSSHQTLVLLSHDLCMPSFPFRRISFPTNSSLLLSDHLQSVYFSSPFFYVRLPSRTWFRFSVLSSSFTFYKPYRPCSLYTLLTYSHLTASLVFILVTFDTVP